MKYNETMKLSTISSKFYIAASVTANSVWLYFLEFFVFKPLWNDAANLFILSLTQISIAGSGLNVLKLSPLSTQRNKSESLVNQLHQLIVTLDILNFPV